MPIILDNQLREQITREITVFPITYSQDELSVLPNWTGPLHWHPDFEIATVEKGILDYQTPPISAVVKQAVVSTHIWDVHPSMHSSDIGFRLHMDYLMIKR